MRVLDHSYACVYTWGLGTPTASQHNIFDSEKLSQICIVLLTQSSNLGSLDLESDALPIEPPHHQYTDTGCFMPSQPRLSTTNLCLDERKSINIFEQQLEPFHISKTQPRLVGNNTQLFPTSFAENLQIVLSSLYQIAFILTSCVF